MYFYLSRLSRFIGQLYNNITNSIAFYPVLITLLYLMLIFGMISLDHSAIAEVWIARFPWIAFKEMETGRTILSTLITGIISLIALSFSMVMVVLNQAISNYSPKVMVGLVSEKAHQFVLGNQLGAVIYFLILLFYLKDNETLRIPTFSISLSILLGIWAMILFVFFIHIISQSVQITNVIKHIHDQTLNSLKQLARKTEQYCEPDTSQLAKLPYAYITDKPGFLQEVRIKHIVKVAIKHDMVIRLHGYLTNYIESRRPLFHSNVPPETLSESDKNLVYNSIIFYHKESVKANYAYGFTQLSEVAVKALSPGINDPGIARLCVQYLSDMFIELYYIKDKTVFTDAEGRIRLIIDKISFDELFNACITPIRQYGKKDLSIVRALLELIKVIGEQDKDEKRYQKILNQQAAFDTKGINNLVEEMHSIKHNYFQLEKLEQEY
jgi:uncharacterized membrane protein